MSCDPLTGFVCFFGKNFKTFARKVGKTKKEKKKKLSSPNLDSLVLQRVFKN
jgi:hypothetical protein